MAGLILFLIALITHSRCEDCMRLDISVTQKVEKEGFHREICWLLETSSPNQIDWIASQCKLALHVDINPGMFVNVEEIEALNRERAYSVRVIGDANIESPAHESRPQEAIVYLPNETNVERVLFAMPIHLRYQRAQIMGKFGRVQLERPSVLVVCPQNITLCGKRRQIVSIPCDYSTPDAKCSWHNTTYQAHFDVMEMFVPIGDLDDYPLVSIVSLLLGCAGCIYVLSVLSTAPL